MSKRIITVYSGCSWNKFGLISAAIHQEPWEFSFEEFSQIIWKVVGYIGYIIYKQRSINFPPARCHLHYISFWSGQTILGHLTLAWTFVVPLQYIRKQGSIIKQVKSGKFVWFSTGIQRGWQPHQTDPSKWLCTSNICNVCPKMTRTYKDHEDNPTGWWRMFWFPSEKKQTDKGPH